MYLYYIYKKTRNIEQNNLGGIKMSRKDFKYMKRIFKRKIKMTLRAMVMFLITGTISLSMTEEEIKKKAEEFRTEEYYYMGSGKGNNPLDTINAAEAYAQGYTGKGVTLGIVDDYVNLSHSEFLNKDNSYIIGELPKDTDWVESSHGTHVAGIMSASKDGKGMNGTAFNSDFASGLLSWKIINSILAIEVKEPYNYLILEKI